MTVRDTLIHLLAAALGGCLYALSNVGFGYWLLAFVYLIPFWFSIDLISRNRRGLTRKPLFALIALAGFLFGCSAFVTGYPWLLVLTDKFLGSGALFGFILWCLLGLWFALAFALYAMLYRILLLAKCPQMLAACVPMVLVEWCQSGLFPSYAGAALIAKPILAQTADLGGPLLLTAFVVFINSTLYSVFKYLIASRGHQSRAATQPLVFPVNHLLAGSALVCVVLIYGDNRQADLQASQAENSSQAFTVGIIQSNLVKLDKATLSQQSHAAHLQQSEEFLANASVDLLIWPETAYIRGLRRPLPLDAQFIRGDITVPLLFGGTSVWQKNGQRVSANSVFLADQNGKIEQAYDKSKLIPFAEYLPFTNLLSQTALWQRYQEMARVLFPHGQHFDSNAVQQALQLSDISIATPICYEIIHPEFVRNLVQETQANLLVTLANDSWFGETQEPWIHLSMARLRAIEHRRWLVRSTNSGISAVIDPGGHIISQTDLNRRQNLEAVVYPVNSVTFYSAYGDWVAWLALIIAVISLVRHLRLSRFARSVPG